MESGIESTDARAERVGARTVLAVLVPFGLGYYLSYLYRTVNAVISPELVAEMALGPADLGLLTAIYFIAFASFQIPLGVLLDRYGPRRVQVALLVIAAVGGAVFALGQSFAALIVGRALIGFGVSACLMAAFKANALWFPQQRLALVNNVIAAFGSFGALSATTPVEAALQVVGWREIFAGIAALTVLLAAATWLAVPERKGGPVETASWRGALAAYPGILASAYFWRVGAVSAICNATFLAYQTLWAGPWLRDVAGLDRRPAAENLFLIQAGMFVGVLSIGLVADRLQRAGISLYRGMAVGLAIFLAVQAALALGATRPTEALWTAFGFFGTSGFLSFSIFSQHYPGRMTGRAITSVNLAVFVLAFAVQWGIGGIIGLYPLTEAGGHPPAAHRAALATMIALEVLAYAYFVWPRRRAWLDNPSEAQPNPPPVREERP